MTMHRFWAQNNSFAPNKKFFGKIISPSSTYWPLSLCKIFKKILQWIQSYEEAPFIFQKKLLIGLTPFIHAYLHATNQSDIDLLMKYTCQRILKFHWPRAISALTWEPDFSQACSFRRMLMNHNNFRFTGIPDKTNDVIFLKNPKCF